MIVSSSLSLRDLVDECVDAVLATEPLVGDEAFGRMMAQIVQSVTFRQAFMRLDMAHHRVFVLQRK